MSSEELLPADEIIEAVWENAISPILKQLEPDIGKLKQYNVRTWRGWK